VIGQTLSHYKILSKLGEGGMGAVYLAEDTTLDRKVALKVLTDELASDPTHLERFEREAKAIAALDHPNIITIHSVEEVDGVRFLTMGYVEGRTLDEVIPSSGLGLTEVMKVALPLVDALCAAHDRGVTHRDLKPSNVMVTPDGSVKVLDFGLAKLRIMDGEGGEEAATQTLTQQGQVMGTVPYMSPEQLQGRTADHRSDIFSLGVMLYEMVTGARPFRGDSSADLVSSILRDTQTPAATLKTGLPAQLDQILSRCLEKEIFRRYQKVADLRADLKAMKADAQQIEEEQTPSIAVLRFVNMSPDPEQDYFCEGIAEELINGLGRIKNLRVASRTSSFKNWSDDLDIREIGLQMNVTTVLEGSVRKAGNQLRVAAQLINVEDGYRLWSDRFDRTLEDVFAIQDEIAENIVKALEVTLSPRERRAIQNVATQDVEAYDFYLRGRKQFYLMSRRSYEAARQMYQRAIELDPGYSLAYSGIADCCSFLYMYAESTAENRRRAVEASQKALELDPDLGEAHASRGLALSLSEDYEAAEREFEEAIKLNPRLFEAYYFYARSCYARGEYSKAAQLFEQASDVRPEDYQAPVLLVQALIGMGLSAERVRPTLERALEIIEETLEANPADSRALYLGAGAIQDLGDSDKAVVWVRRALALEPDEPWVLYNVACIYSRAGETEQALDCLERSVDQGMGDKAWLAHDTDFDPIRDQPRFAALLERLGN